MKRSELNELFQRDLNGMSEAGRSFYRACRRAIARARRKNESAVQVYGHTTQETRQACVLLTHARNGFRAVWKVDALTSRPFIEIELKGA